MANAARAIFMLTSLLICATHIYYRTETQVSSPIIDIHQDEVLEVLATQTWYLKIIIVQMTFAVVFAAATLYLWAECHRHVSTTPKTQTNLGVNMGRTSVDRHTYRPGFKRAQA